MTNAFDVALVVLCNFLPSVLGPRKVTIDAREISVFRILYTLLSQWEFLPWETRVAFPKESQLQQSRARYPTVINFRKCMLGSFRASIIHRTRTCTTGSLTCVRDHPYACVYNTRGFGQHRQRVSTILFDSGKKLSQFCSCAPDADGVRTSGLWISSPPRRSTN